MSKAFSAQGSLTYPPDTGQPSAVRAVSQSGTFASKQEAELVLVGSGTHVVDFGTVAKAKAVLVDVHADSAAPAGLIFNGGAEPIEVSPGGSLQINSPSPATGITALSIVHTDDVNVDVYILE
jgi:hypothetical protein